MKIIYLKKAIHYLIASSITLNSFSLLPSFAEIDAEEKNSVEMGVSSNFLNTEYFKQIPVNDYIIGSGDTLRISISREYPELLTLATVDGEGTIYLPRTNRIFVKGLSIKELNKLLDQRYKEFVKFPAAEVEVSSYRPIKVLVNGEVANPGVKTLEGSMSFDNEEQSTISSNLGSMSNNYNTSTIEKKLDQSILGLLGNTNTNAGNFNLSESSLGNGMNQYRNTTNYYFPTVIDALRDSGGLTEYSDLTSVEIIRRNNISEGGGKMKTTLNLEGLFYSTDDSQNIRIYDGDIINVSRLEEPNGLILTRAIRAKINPSSINILVAGRVNNPGLTLVFRDSTLNDAIDLAGGTKLLKGPVRYVSFNNNGTLDKRQFRYSRKNKRGSYKNPYLSNGDVIIVGDSALSITNDIITEFTAPFTGLFTTYALIKTLDD